MSDRSTHIGSRLRHFRALRGMTQEALARSAKLTPKFLSQIENGHVNPSIGVLTRLVNDGLSMALGAFFSWHPDDGDAFAVIALIAQQPVEFRRRLVRALVVLCEQENPAAAPLLPRTLRS